jgi:hypothetical protein
MTGGEWIIFMLLTFKGDAYSRKYNVVSHKENRQCKHNEILKRVRVTICAFRENLRRQSRPFL